MAANEPSGLHELFTKYFNSGDLDGLVSLYEDGATLVAAPGAVAVGTDAIRTTLQGFLGFNGTIEFVGSDVCFVSDDLALSHGKWVMKVPGVDDIEASTAEVSRRQPDGTWKYVIDNPVGTQVLDVGAD
jgi:uncharacterized protein (TIGR02246 family)